MNLESSKIGIIGLGYVGLPLAVEFGKHYDVTGFDIDGNRIKDLKSGLDKTLELTAEEINKSKYLSFTDQIDDLLHCNTYIITVPTPIDKNNIPNLEPLKNASILVGGNLKKDKVRDLTKYIFNQSIKIFGDINFIKKYDLKFSKTKIKEKKVFLSIDSHHNQNNWKEDYFIKFTDKLLFKKKIKKIYINFSPNKKTEFQKILKKFSKNKKIYFTYREKFEKIITIINNCSYIVGNESGPACLGASMGKNVFSIYDPKHTPNLSSKIINKKITYLNSKKLNVNSIIRKLISKIN